MTMHIKQADAQEARASAQELSPVFTFVPHLLTVGDEARYPTLTEHVPILPSDITRESSTTVLNEANYDYDAIPGPNDDTRCIIIGRSAIEQFTSLVATRSREALNFSDKSNSAREKLAMLSRRAIFLSALENNDSASERNGQTIVDRDSESFQATLDYMVGRTFLCMYDSAEKIVDRLLRAKKSENGQETLEGNINNGVIDMLHTSSSLYIYDNDPDLRSRIAASLRRHLLTQVDLVTDDRQATLNSLRAQLAKTV